MLIRVRYDDILRYSLQRITAFLLCPPETRCVPSVEELKVLQ